MELTRRHLLAGSAALGGALLTGCGSASPETTADPGGGGGAFPVTVKHKFGETVIESQPKRVVTIGYTDHDALLALGIAPVGVRFWYGPEGVAIQSWAQAAAKTAGAAPEVLTMKELQAETVLALNPDLIIGIYSDLDETSYAQLSKITKTVGPPPGFADYGVGWKDTTRLIAQAVGRTDQGNKLIADIEKQFAEAKAANPQWAGKEVVVANRSADSVFAFASQDSRSRFFSDLGFVVPAEIDQFAGGKFFAELGLENTSKLDRDLLVWDQVSFTPGGRATIEADPLIAGLAATKAGRSFFIDDSTELAFAWQTVLSIPAAATAIIPQIEKALPK